LNMTQTSGYGTDWHKNVTFLTGYRRYVPSVHDVGTLFNLIAALNFSLMQKTI